MSLPPVCHGPAPLSRPALSCAPHLLCVDLEVDEPLWQSPRTLGACVSVWSTREALVSRSGGATFCCGQCSEHPAEGASLATRSGVEPVVKRLSQLSSWVCLLSMIRALRLRNGSMGIGSRAPLAGSRTPEQMPLVAMAGATAIAAAGLKVEAAISSENSEAWKKGHVRSQGIAQKLTFSLGAFAKRSISRFVDASAHSGSACSAARFDGR